MFSYGTCINIFSLNEFDWFGSTRFSLECLIWGGGGGGVMDKRVTSTPPPPPQYLEMGGGVMVTCIYITEHL